MSGINSVSGVGPPVGPGRGGAVEGGAKADEDKGFGKMLQNCVEQADRDQQASAAAIQQLLTGKSQDVLGVVSAVAKADLSFKLLLGVRNKVIEAYKQTMNMQV